MPTVLFVLCKLTGFGLLFASWTASGGAAGFFPMMALAIMTVLRYRLPKWRYTVFIDGMLLLILGQFLASGIFVVSELFYRAWEDERARGLRLRDMEANRYYELEQLQGDLLAASARVERMAAVSERARIAGEIHDNAGHEIIAAYLSLQAARPMFAAEDTQALELYDAALARLDSGVNKIRRAVHNLAPVTALGVETLRETCGRFPGCEVLFSVRGDLTPVPIYGWNLLEACLREALTNVVRHADAKQVRVDLDAAPNIVRLCVENDGAKSKVPGTGIGLRGLRRRAAAAGGNLSVDAGEVFRVICVIPIGEHRGEGP